MTPDLIRQRYDYLTSERKTSENVWEEIRYYVAPYRAEFFNTASSEQSIRQNYAQIYDGTGLQANQILASNLHGNLTSPYVPWFNMGFRDEMLEDDSDARAWVEEVATAIWNTLQESNFAREIAEAYMDLTTFGTACLVEEAASGDPTKWDGVNFTCIPLKEMYFEERPDGTVSHFYRGTMMTPLQILEKFGADCPSDIKDKAEGAQAVTERENIIFCVFPRNPKAIRGGDNPTEHQPPSRRPYGFRYVRAKDSSPIGKEGGYYEMPAFVTRWSKISESRWGHGPSHYAIYDIKTLNRQEELTLQALAKNVDPPQVTTERGLLGDLDSRPGGLTVVRNMQDLGPMKSGSDWRAIDLERQNRRNMIREYYLVSHLDLKESPAMTATEVERRWQQMQKLLGPTLGRLQADLLSPIVETTFAILARAGRLPEIPQSVSDSQSEMDIEFTGPMPLAQRQDAARAIEAEFALVAEVSKVFGPDVLDVLDAQKGVRQHARLKGVPSRMIRGDAKLEKMKKDREKKAAAAQQMAMVKEGAGVMKDMGAGEKNHAQAEQARAQMGAPPGGGGDMMEQMGGDAA